MVDDDDGDESPSPEPRTDFRSAIPRGFRAWRRLRIIKRDDLFSPIFSPRKQIYRVGVGVGGAPGGPRGRGRAQGDSRAPTLVARVWAPWSSSFARIFLLFLRRRSVKFQVIPKLLFLHINNTMESLLKTASVRVSSIQIMQVRVQNKGKSVWKSRYDGDISASTNIPSWVG